MENLKTLLALDTAMGGCGVCIYDVQDGVLAQRVEPMSHGQAERLMPMVEELMDEAGLGYAALHAIITTRGPGAFTGLRVGLAAAKALSLALGIPLYGLSTMQALAAGYDAQCSFGVLVETRRDDFYVQFFDAQSLPLGEPEVMSAADIHAQAPDMLFIGDGAARYQSLAPQAKIEKDIILPDIARGSAFLLQHPDLGVRDPEPLYLRGAEISKPKHKPRQISA